MKKETRVSTVFWISVIATVVGAISVVTGVQEWSHSTLRGTEVVRYDFWERIFAGGVTALCAFIAFGIRRRELIAWKLVTICLGISVPWTVVYAIATAVTIDLPIGALLFGSVGELAKVVILILILWKWWIPTKPLFARDIEQVAAGNVR